MPPLDSIMKDEEEFLFLTFASRISQRSVVIHSGRESSPFIRGLLRDVIYARGSNRFFTKISRCQLSRLEDFKGGFSFVCFPDFSILERESCPSFFFQNKIEMAVS